MKKNKLNIYTIFIIILSFFLLSNFAFAISMSECNFDESMCPDNCGELIKTKVLEGYGSGGYGTESMLTCEYNMGSRDGNEFSDRMTFYYRCFENPKDAETWVDYYENPNPEGPPPFCTGNLCNSRRLNHQWMGTLSGYSAKGNYYSDGNIAANMGYSFNEQEKHDNIYTIKDETITREEGNKIIDEYSSCQKTLKEPLPFIGTLLRLHIDNHPLKNIKVIINDKIYTTNDEGEIKIPNDGEATIQFTYFDKKEYFSIFVSGEKKVFELQLKTKDEIITEGVLDNGNEKVTIDINKEISSFNFENLANELYSSAKRYIHISEALEFYQDLEVEFSKPVKVVTFINYEGVAAYNDYKILIDSSVSYAEHKWSPFTEYHEFSHYAMNQMYGDEFYTELLKSPNHGGFANPTTTDSWIEGFAAFMPVIIANHNKRWWADGPLETRASFYPMAGSLDANYKAWDQEGKAEEFAIASFLWDYIDGESHAYASTALSDILYLQFFNIWDENKDEIITAEEIYIGQLMDEYAKTAELDHISWYFMIEMGKNMEDYFDLEPNMKLFDKYNNDNNDEFLDLDELSKMAEILNDVDGYIVEYEWLDYYDENGDEKISKEEAKHLFKGYEIIMEISDNNEISDRNDVKKWIEDERIIKYINEKGMKPLKDEMKAREFSEYALEQISGNDDDNLEWTFEALWESVLSKKHKDFTSVLESLKLNDTTYLENFAEVIALHGMYQKTNIGDKIYNIGEAYVDTNKNEKWDSDETFIDYPPSWTVQENDTPGAPSNYERIGRHSSPYFKGNFVKTSEGEHNIMYLIKDGMKIVDIVGYTTNSDGMIYVPISSDSIIIVSDKDNMNSVVFNSVLFEENFDKIIEQGYVDELKSNNYFWFLITIIIVIVGVVYVKRKGNNKTKKLKKEVKKIKKKK